MPTPSGPLCVDRRVRGRRWASLLSGLLVLAALALMVSALGVGAGGRPWDDAPESADGHPQRIERPYVVRDLPARPGPVAGLVSDGLSWFAVSGHGRLWRLDDVAEPLDVQPALSGDGRVLAYLRETSGGGNEYVLRDLVSGELTAFPQLGNGDGGDLTFFVAPQHPTSVSPDGKQVLVQGARLDGRNADALLVTEDGVREVFVKGVAWPVGWSPDGRLAWLVTPTHQPTQTPELLATDTSGKEIGRLPLELRRPATFHQWSAALSPDGTVLTLVPEDADGGRELLRLATQDGSVVDRHPAPEATGCAPSWRGDEPLVPTVDHVLADLDGGPVVVADPSLEAACSIWATDALAGDRHGGLTGAVFGTSTSWLSWRWREVGAGEQRLLAATGVPAAGRGRRGSADEGDPELSG